MEELDNGEWGSYHGIEANISSLSIFWNLIIVCDRLDYCSNIFYSLPHLNLLHQKSIVSGFINVEGGSVTCFGLRVSGVLFLAF